MSDTPTPREEGPRLLPPTAISNRRRIGTDPSLCYSTPPWATRLLLDHEDFAGGTFLEPCCGAGAMAEVLAERGPVHASDLYDHGYGETGINALDYAAAEHWVTNPPYEIASELLAHALRITRGKVCLLLRVAFLESAARYRRFFRTTPPTRVWIFPQRITMYPLGYAVRGRGTTAYAWYVWDQQQPGAPTELRWFPTGRKEN